MKMKTKAARRRSTTGGFSQAGNPRPRGGVLPYMRLLLLASLLLAACGPAYGSAAAGRASASPVTATITTADDGGTVTVHVGDRVQIALGEQYEWKLDPPDGVVLTHPVQNYMLVRGTQAIWLASSVGRSVIHATGTAACATGQPCPQLAVAFTVTIDVVP